MSRDDWLSDHLLGEETESDAAEARRRLDRDPQLRDRVARLAEVTERLELLSPAAWDAAAAEPDGAVAARPGAVTRDGARRRGLSAPALAVLVAAVLVAIGIGAGALIWSGGGAGPAGGGAQPAGRTVALRPLPGVSARAAGSAAVTAGRLTLTVDRLPPAGAGRYYEAWLMSDTRHLVSLVSFEVRDGGRARLIVPLPAPVDRYRYFDVSRQSIVGGTAHSPDSVLRGATGS